MKRLMKPICLLPLLLLFIVFGCVKNDVNGVADAVIVTKVIDIGQVRVKDTPAKTSFTITNHSSVLVEIDEVLSGCGCTVIDLPQKTIQPGKTLEVPMKIDLFGRRGDFNTDIVVRSTSGESWHIRVTGKVIEDLWYAGQSLRFHIDLDQETVSKEFSISTIDYPNVQFEFETNDPDLHLSELSRSAQEGETKILLQLTVQNAQRLRTSSRIELIPTNEELPRLSIPVFYHHLWGEQKQWLATSQVNLGEIKQDEQITVKLYGSRTFLCNIHKVQAVSKDDVITVVSYTVPASDSDPLEVVITIADVDDQALVRGSLTLFSHDNESTTVQVSGIVK